MAKIPHPLLPLTLLVLATGFAASAQNSDFGVLAGVMSSPHETVGGSRASITTSDGGAVEFNYAYQVKGWKAGDLYVEIPFILAGRDENWVGSGGASLNTTVVGAVLSGVRFKLPLGGRASLYAAAGAGFGAYGENALSSSPGSASNIEHTTVTAAFDFGGGLDLRLTRLLSLRGEVRDLILSRSGLSSPGGHNNPIFAFGFAFHF
ncbi:MAG TPA: outer membrane beta-barrel protein [Bryobacteraceae bacterium]|nr:outer membrane beta-barrel protein [Bryobacteraceae bacterium]